MAFNARKSKKEKKRNDKSLASTSAKVWIGCNFFETRRLEEKTKAELAKLNSETAAPSSFIQTSPSNSFADIDAKLKQSLGGIRCKATINCILALFPLLHCVEVVVVKRIFA